MKFAALFCLNRFLFFPANLFFLFARFRFLLAQILGHFGRSFQFFVQSFNSVQVYHEPFDTRRIDKIIASDLRLFEFFPESKFLLFVTTSAIRMPHYFQFIKCCIGLCIGSSDRDTEYL